MECPSQECFESHFSITFLFNSNVVCARYRCRCNILTVKYTTNKVSNGIGYRRSLQIMRMLSINQSKLYECMSISYLDIVLYTITVARELICIRETMEWRAVEGETQRHVQRLHSLPSDLRILTHILGCFAK